MALATGERVGTDRAGAFPLRWAARPTHHRLVHELRLAAAAEDPARLARVLHPDIAVVVDAGDESHPTIRMVRGVAESVPLLLHGMASSSGIVIEERQVNGQPGLLLRRGDQAVALVSVDVTAHLVSAVWVALKPTVLRRWNGT